MFGFRFSVVGTNDTLLLRKKNAAYDNKYKYEYILSLTYTFALPT